MLLCRPQGLLHGYVVDGLIGQAHVVLQISVALILVAGHVWFECNVVGYCNALGWD